MELWERLAAPDPRGVLEHRRTSAAPTATHGRLAEVTAELARVRGALREACATVRVLRQPDRWPRMDMVSFSGVPAAQYWVDFWLWEAVLNATEGLTGIVEIGTWEGGFSRYLHAQAACRGLAFRTYDVVAPKVMVPDFVQADVFAEAAEICGWLSRQGPVALFCDGGNKPRELATFPPYCAAGSVFLVHDWGTETLPADVPPGLRMIHGELCEEIGSITRVFVKQ